MYLAVNLPRTIASLGGVIFLTASRMICQLLKCMGRPPHLPMCSLILFWLPLSPQTSLPTSIGPYLKQQ